MDNEVENFNFISLPIPVLTFGHQGFILPISNARQMSTFNGIVEEFPCIQIDYFRKNPDRPSPLACFLSHVHSDHLQGLESFRAPFIYCSVATRELLLRIEKYPHRINFSKGILESRRLHYKHLSKLLRPIPLNTPTEVELTPRLRIRVTLLDANHCTGAVMFLIEGDGKAILYTGDIRAETWWVNNLIRHPVLIPYTLGNKRLDKIYLDTTFARASNIYRTFPSKAEGLAELLQKVEAYPDDTVFYCRAWTFGYEDVWVALSAALNTKIHVDRYQMGLYASLGARLRGSSHVNEATSLCGFELGNRFVPGCLSDDEDSRIHSCVPGVPCFMVKSRKMIHIVPIVNRMSDGSEVPDIGAGGGTGDLYQVHELELPDKSALDELEKLCLEHIDDSEVLSRTMEALSVAFRSKNKALLLDTYGLKDDSEISLKKLITILSYAHSGNAEEKPLLKPTELSSRNPGQHGLPDTIHFPYSRHSSYMELCELVSAFKPKDVFPCTVDPLTWSEEVSMRRLFGHLCSGNEFTHDVHMREMLANDEVLHAMRKARYDCESQSQSTQQSSMLDGDSREAIENGTLQIQQDGIAARTCFNLGTENVGTDSTFCPVDGKRDYSSTSVAEQHPAFPPKRSTSTMITTRHADEPIASSPSLLSPSKRRDRATNTSTNINSPKLTPKPLNEPLKVPEITPEAEKAKRNEIRRARQYLKMKERVLQESGILCIDPLPLSWGSEAEDGLVGTEDSCHFVLDHNHEARREKSRKRKISEVELESVPAGQERQKQPRSPYTRCSYQDDQTGRSHYNHDIADVDNMDINMNLDMDTNPEDNNDQDTQKTTTSTLSISDSAFDSQQLLLSLDGYELTTEPQKTENTPSLPPTPIATSNGNGNVTRHSLARSNSARNRKAAYFAARADSYDAWSSMSLLSAGNNHTEEEMEL